jgi:hypothetical protein
MHRYRVVSRHNVVSDIQSDRQRNHQVIIFGPQVYLDNERQNTNNPVN